MTSTLDLIHDIDPGFSRSNFQMIHKWEGWLVNTELISHHFICELQLSHTSPWFPYSYWHFSQTGPSLHLITNTQHVNTQTYFWYSWLFWLECYIVMGLILWFTEAPKLDLSSLLGQEIRVRAGEPISIDIPIKGSPTPTIVWKKDGKEIPATKVTAETFWRAVINSKLGKKMHFFTKFILNNHVLLSQHVGSCSITPDSKVHGANMGPIWGQQDPGGPHVGPMNFAILERTHPAQWTLWIAWTRTLILVLLKPYCS